MIQVVAEWKAQAALTVEHHDADPIAAAKYLHRVMRRLGKTLDVRLHASAYVEKQQHVNRHIFALEVTDVLLLDHLPGERSPLFAGR